MMKLQTCLKTYSKDQDKAISPQETIGRVREKLSGLNMKILSSTGRVDIDRLGIPVFISACGADARAIMPTRKQMGKGVSLEQAEASALMELIERFSFFSFFENQAPTLVSTWTDAKKISQEGKILPLIDIQELIRSAHDNIEAEVAEKILDLTELEFYPAIRILDGKELLVPLDWFRKLGEFNGSSAGNTDVESILQGCSELVERHVSCIADRTKPILPTIDLDSCTNPVLKDLIKKFQDNKIVLLLKDMSLGQALPTVAALAYDPATFPKTSEIVFTAGTASSPTKAAIRAITEVAQLGGDFATSSCYEASGLSKYMSHEEHEWLEKGELVALNTLPSVENNDIYQELLEFCKQLKEKQGLNLYSLSTTNPLLDISANYSFIPGFKFRERDVNASVGLFIGRLIVERYLPVEARKKIKKLAELQPNAHYLKFFNALINLEEKSSVEVAEEFIAAQSEQTDNESKALCAFYAGYAYSLVDEWKNAKKHFYEAVTLEPTMKEYWHRLGICFFKLGRYEQAAQAFQRILKDLDKGSALDYANLGICLAKLGQKKEAIDNLSIALTLDSSLDFAAKALEEL